jgi:outer membrane protein insertion porin family
VISKSKSFRRAGALFLIGTVLGGSAAPLLAQGVAPASPPGGPAPAPAARAPATERVVRSIAVTGNQRLEPETIRAYANLLPGQTYTAVSLDQALKDLYATQLFADVTISGGDTGDLVISVRENPVINRIVLDGNKRIKDDKIPRSSLRRGRFSRVQARARMSSASSSCTAVRADSPRGSSPRSSSSTRIASMWCSRFTRATWPRCGRST